ncbi:Ras-associating and dilute domain-containing protein [Tupaia chinensis]|uniref:Small ribosomal subunit protein eS8 n=1 Tax=Tupaia chinensis TaxID=246437 RepID=L9L400_TUPCH|nr:Ras-associating and dilute domain-containing protein [Tupaia chinensis]
MTDLYMQSVIRKKSGIPQPSPILRLQPPVPVHEDSPTMFYGTHFIMSPPTKSKLKRQSQLLSSVLSRTLSYKYRDLDATFSSLGASDDPAELSTQLSAPGVLKVFGDSVSTGTHYKSVLATGASSAQELVKEALERYALDPACARQYVLCDVVGQAGGSGQRWQAQCFRVFGDNEKPLLIQELWKPREGLSRRFELRKKSDVEELAAKDVDTTTAECCTCKTRIIDVVYNASNNELVRTKTLVKNYIALIDSTPYRQWYESHYTLPLGLKKKGAKLSPEEEEILNKKRSKKIQKKYDERKKMPKSAVSWRFSSSRASCLPALHPDQASAALPMDGYVLEGKELEFYLRKIKARKGK